MNPSDRTQRFILGTSFGVLLIATVVVLRLQGRNWYCSCSEPALWVSDIWSAHCSQHLIDPYSFTHASHGFFFCLVAWLFLPKIPFLWRLWMATFVECGWEIIENSSFIIDRYRQVTISIGYEGDSILNSLGDVGSCALGFVLARYLGLRRSVYVFLLTEIVLLFTIRDNLTLNVLMLVWPVDSIKAWQMGA